MLPKKSRLNLAKNHQTSAFLGKRIRAEGFDVIYKELAYLKAAVVVSKKIAPKAVDRNRIKRLISEALKDEKTFKGGLLFIAKVNFAQLKQYEVDLKIKNILKRIINGKNS